MNHTTAVNKFEFHYLSCSVCTHDRSLITGRVTLLKENILKTQTETYIRLQTEFASRVNTPIDHKSRKRL